MGHATGKVSKTLLSTACFIFLVVFVAHAQYETLSLLETSSRNGDETVQFNFKFESESSEISGRAESFIEDYDSIAILSYKFVKQDDEKILRLDSYVINKATQHRLKWVTAVDYVETDKNSGVVLASNEQTDDTPEVDDSRFEKTNPQNNNTSADSRESEPVVTKNSEPERRNREIEELDADFNENTTLVRETDVPSGASEINEPLKEYTHTKEDGEKVVYKEAKKLISGKFIQFGAFSIFKNATGELARLEGFRIRMIRVNDQYKLIAPYTRSDFRKARAAYPEKKVWPVIYQQQELVVLEEQ